MARSSPTTVVSVRTTPFTCGSHASVTIMIRCEGAGGSISSQPINSSRMRWSGSGALRRSARREERQSVGRRPIDQLKLTIVMFHQGGAALHPVAVVEIQYTLHLAHFRVVDVAAHDAVEPTATRFVGERRFVAIDSLARFLDLAFEPGRQ